MLFYEKKKIGIESPIIYPSSKTFARLVLYQNNSALSINFRSIQREVQEENLKFYHRREIFSYEYFK